MSEAKAMPQIYEIHTYMNEEGMLIKVHTPKTLSDVGESGNLFSKTRIMNDGTGQKITGNIGIKTNQGIRPLEFVFPKGYTIIQAFQQFSEEANKAAAKFMQMAREEAEKHAKAQKDKEGDESRIIVPKSTISNPRKN